MDPSESDDADASTVTASSDASAEKAAIGYLLPHLPEGVGIDVRGAGGRFVRVRRVGGTSASPLHDAPMLDVLVWHDSDLERMALAQHVWAVLRAAAGGSRR